MMKVLAFDTSSKALSVAILDGENLLADVTVNIKKNHSINLMPAIDFLMKAVDLKQLIWIEFQWLKVLAHTLGFVWQLRLQKHWHTL